MIIWGGEEMIFSKFPQWWSVFLVAAFGLLFDIIMEPVAIALDFWRWPMDIVPLQNYIAWFVLGIDSLYFAARLMKPHQKKSFPSILRFRALRIFYRHQCVYMVWSPISKKKALLGLFFAITGFLSSQEISPNFLRATYSDSALITADQKGRIHIWDTQDLIPLKVLEVTDERPIFLEANSLGDSWVLQDNKNHVFGVRGTRKGGRSEALRTTRAPYWLRPSQILRFGFIPPSVSPRLEVPGKL
jgi:hypothetical protein